MPVENKTEDTAVPTTNPKSDLPIKQLENTKDVNEEKMPMLVSTNEPLENTTEKDVPCVDEKKKEVKQEEKGSKTNNENKENVEESGSGEEKRANEAFEVKGKPADNNKRTEDIVLRKRRTPDKKEANEEVIIPPKKPHVK
ncbi:protein MNN4-like [Dendronephthya gigantea]|uniref:protein MNN4-like n=1 Tax=Dendronephthya gigantea TaxID=151771 RepID=UPI00106A71CA|nr:protein MNN4-like [Dendronephthya gigantea]